MQQVGENVQKFRGVKLRQPLDDAINSHFENIKKK